jgi:hypothetical protein
MGNVEALWRKAEFDLACRGNFDLWEALLDAQAEGFIG